MCTPIVTTPRCSYALGTQDGVHLLIAEEPQACADSIVKLLDNPQLAQQLGTTGRRFVTENYSWTISTNVLNRLYDATVAKPQQEVAADPAWMEMAQQHAYKR